MQRRSFIAIVAVAAAALLAAIVLSPFFAPYGTFAGLDGTPSFINHSWRGTTDLMYLLGDFICHQQEARSFILNGSQLPFCIRDVSLLAGFAAGMVLCHFLDGRLSDRRFAWLGAALVAVTAVEWAVEGCVGDMEELRIATGLISGAGVALFLGWMLYRETGETGRLEV